MTHKTRAYYTIEPAVYDEFEKKVKEVGMRRSQVVEQLLVLWIDYIYPKIEKSVD